MMVMGCVEPMPSSYITPPDASQDASDAGGADASDAGDSE